MTTTSTDEPCLFCSLPAGRVIQENDHAILILDGYPVSPGHSLIIPKRHIGSFFNAKALERAALLALLDKAKELVEQTHRPAGYNIGINDGAAVCAG